MKDVLRDQAFLAGGFEVGDAFDAQSVVQGDDFIESQAGKFTELDGPRR